MLRRGRSFVLPVALAALLGAGIAPVAQAVPQVATASFPQQLAPRFENPDTQGRQDVSDVWVRIRNLLRVPDGWTGKVDRCEAGLTSQDFRDATLGVVNAVRELAGQSPVTENPTMSATAQEAAFMMKVNRTLSHFPPQSWDCWSQAGYEGATKSNLYLGRSGPDAILGYMVDPGSSNALVGHRRWILFGGATEVGIGNTDTSDALQVIGGRGTTSPQKWTAWPTEGWFPNQLWPQEVESWSGGWRSYAPARLSLSYPRADFSRAAVSMTRNGEPVDVALTPAKVGFGDNTISWDVYNATPDPHGNDVTYSVDVSNIVMPGGLTTSHKYSFTTYQARADERIPFEPIGRPEAALRKGKVTVSWIPAIYRGAGEEVTFEVVDQQGNTMCSTLRSRCRFDADFGRSTFKVRAGNTFGWSRFGDVSEVVSYGKRPTPPRGLKAKVKGNKVTVTWEVPKKTFGPIVEYRYWVGYGPVKKAKGRQAVFRLEPGWATNVYVIAVNKIGTSRATLLRVKNPLR